MKVLTIRQPYASLIALGVKTIETRSWSTAYRGPLVFHAAARRPTMDIAGYSCHEERLDHLWWLQHPAAPGHAHPDVSLLPLGAIVATCVVADVVPVFDGLSGQKPPRHYLMDCEHEGHLPHQEGGLWLFGPGRPNYGMPTRVQTERPFGDFAPGRFAWLLDNVQALDEPVPFKGAQGLTKTWEPS